MIPVGRLVPARAFQVAQPASAWRNGVKTAAQIVGVWTFALLVLPLLVRGIGGGTGSADLGGSGPLVLGGALLAAGSAGGLWSAWVMATLGEGTPVPFDAARRLVVVGPYGVVRNPMVMTALAQSTGVALLLRSPPSLLIPLAGGLVWNQVLRPAEERFLVERFGRSYLDYRDQVRCWVPTWRRRVRLIAIRVNGPKAWDLHLTIDFVFGDLGHTYRLELTNGVLIQDVDPTAGTGLTGD